MRNLLLRCTLSIALASLLAGCMGSGPYTPISSWEKRTFEQASRDVFPDDVRQESAKYRDTLVAWPGVVLDSKLVTHPDSIEVRLSLEHHYYDWIEDFGPRNETILLSPRGEGRFQTSWYMTKEGGTEEIEEAFRAGNLLIVYGVAEHVHEDKSISVKASYIRTIDKQWYTTKVFDYGRE